MVCCSLVCQHNAHLTWNISENTQNITWLIRDFANIEKTTMFLVAFHFLPDEFHFPHLQFYLQLLQATPRPTLEFIPPQTDAKRFKHCTCVLFLHRSEFIPPQLQWFQSTNKWEMLWTAQECWWKCCRLLSSCSFVLPDSLFPFKVWILFYRWLCCSDPFPSIPDLP